MAEKFGWAYIGAGGIARKTAGSILKTGNHLVVSVYSRTYEKTEDFAKSYGAVPCRSIQEAIGIPGTDAVYISTTNDNHYASAKECLSAGKSVLLEKPFTLNKKEAVELVRIAKETKVYLAEAMWTWFSPVSLQVKKWVNDREAGSITHIGISYVKRVSRLNLRLFDNNLGGGALLDVGVYPLTYLYNLLGFPINIKCEGIIEHNVDVEENVTLTFRNGLSVTAEISIIKSPDYENLVIMGTEGIISCSNFHTASRAELKKTDGRATVFEGNGWYDNQFNLVAGEIRAGKLESDYIPLKATLDVMEIMDECRRQMNIRYPSE